MSLIKNFWPLAFFAIVIIITSLFGYNGLYGQDAHAYFQFSQKLQALIWGGQDAAGDFFWPVFYPFLGALFSFKASFNAFVLQSLSVASLAATAFLIIKIVAKTEKSKASFFVLIAFCLAPTPLLYSLNIMADSLTVFLIMGVFFCAKQFAEKNKESYFLFAVGFALAAFLTRYAAAVVVVLPCLWLVFLLFKQKKWGLIFKSIAIIALTALPHVLIKGLDQQAVAHHWLANWNLINFFQSEFQTVDGLHIFPRPNIAFVLQHAFHPRFLAIGALLLVFIRKEDIKTTFYKIVLGSILLYAFFLGGITYQSNRYLLLTYPLICVFLFPAFLRIIAFLSSKKTWLVPIFIGGFAVLQLTFFSYFFRPFYLRNQLEQEVVQVVNSRSEKLIYSFGMEVALESYEIKQEVKSLWEVAYPDFEENALVLFNLAANEKQWEGRNPMINWERLQKTYQLEKVQAWDGGWELFRITSKWHTTSCKKS